MKIHSCHNSTLGDSNPVFLCKACPFVGSLEDAIAHVVKNQFEVKDRDNRRPKLAFPKNTKEQFVELPAFRPKQLGRRSRDFLSGNNKLR